jgi:hypothetical protein
MENKNEKVEKFIQIGELAKKKGVIYYKIEFWKN